MALIAVSNFVDHPRGIGIFSASSCEIMGWFEPMTRARCACPTPIASSRFLSVRPRYAVAMRTYNTLLWRQCK